MNEIQPADGSLLPQTQVCNVNACPAYVPCQHATGCGLCGFYL